MTDRVEELKHFAHEHPLIFNESEDIPFHCNACGLRILSSPSYICTVQGCSFYLHEPCTSLPETLSGRLIHHRHDLHLHTKPPLEDCRCSRCGKLCKNFTYHCDICDAFDLDPLCGHPLKIRIKHISHKEHPMVVSCKESLLLCDVCGREHRGFFFHCHQCNFSIHQDCVSLPSILRVGRHRIALVASGALVDMHGYSSLQCGICEENISEVFGAYDCFHCYNFFHVDCAVSTMENTGEILHLPALDYALPSLIKHRKLEEINATLESSGEAMLEKYHGAHSSILKNDETAHESVCNACIQLIAPPYYSCSQSTCDFILHKYCADLPLVTYVIYLSSTRHLVFPRLNEFFSLFFCQICSRFGNSFGYSGGSNICHLECALAPDIIKHDSHKQHPLIMGGGAGFEDIRSCCSKKNPYFYGLYSCAQCRFSIHIRCALLPKTITHKFDEHPLTLITDPSARDLGDDHLCELCEEDINPSYWFYRCIECDNSFHVDCIPSTGIYSRVKFGGTMVLPCHSDHPLTLVRMLSVGSQNCGICHNNNEGFKDGMALHCAECDFWIHFRCGSESSSVIVSEPYRDITYFYNSISPQTRSMINLEDH